MISRFPIFISNAIVSPFGMAYVGSDGVMYRVYYYDDQLHFNSEEGGIKTDGWLVTEFIDVFSN